MIICLVELTDGEGGEFWIGRRDDFPLTNVNNIRGKKNVGGTRLSYEPYRVHDASNLNARLHSFDTDSYIIKRSLDYLNVPSAWRHRKEHRSQILFRDILRFFGHTMTFPKYENTATDWFLTGSISVQDKTVGWNNGWQYRVNFHKNNGWIDGKKQIQPYALGDNDIYLIFVLDQEYDEDDFEGSAEDFLALAKKASLRGCYMFREADLLATRHIATATQPGKIALYLPVPNADGTFNANKRGAKRTHNFSHHYFHHTKFKSLVDELMKEQKVPDKFYDTEKKEQWK